MGFNVGAYFTCSVGVNGTIQPTYVSLPKIDRRSALTLSKSTFNIGDEIKATITQYISNYHQDLYMVIGNNEVLIESSASGTVDIDTSLLANQIYQQIPNAKYYDREFRLKTFDSNNNLIGTDVKSYRANVIDSEPTFDVAYEDIDPTTLAITNNNQQIIQNQSALRISITNATPKHYANLSSVSVTINGVTTTESISSASKNVDIGTINVSSNTNAQVTITDSRGFTTTKTVALTILEWHIPNAIITLQRQQNFYTETDITVDANYSSLDSKNTILIQCRYKKTSEATWGSWNNLSDNVLSTFNLDNTYSWDVEVKLTDSLDSYTYTGLSVGIGLPPFFIDRRKRSIGVNCFPQYDNSIEINEVDASNTYSTTERPIGRWIDGKKIYRIVIQNCRTPSSLNTWQKIVEVSNVDTLVSLNGWYFGADGRKLMLNHSEPNAEMSTTFLNGYIEMSTPYSNWLNKDCWFIVEYTKITD